MSKWATKHLTVLTILLFCTGSVYAEDCASLIALSKTVSTRTHDKKSIDENAAAFCSDYRRYKNDRSNSNFGASYKFLSASMGKSSASVDEVASSYCSSSDNYAARSDAYKEYIETIAPQAYPAYETCMRMRNDATKVSFGLDVGSVIPTQFTLNAAFTSNMQGATAVLTYSKSKDVTCTWQGQENTAVRITMAAGSTAVLECERQDPSKESFVKVSNVTIASLDSSFTLPWQAYRDGLPVNALQVLMNEVAQARQALSARGVGQIVASMLSVTKFQETYNINGEQWELAKGQDAPPDSRYRTDVGEKLPDLRGVFLRGKNHGREVATGNPEGDPDVGAYQKDEVVTHTHGLTQLDIGGGEDDGRSDNVRAKYKNKVEETTDPYGGKETRPRNVTVNYFIRVN